MRKNMFIVFAGLLLIGHFIQCKKKDVPDIKAPPVNIVLHDQPLSVIQKYITGNWSLKYIEGGFIYQKIIEKNNAYMKLTPTHVMMGDNRRGVTVDTTIEWVNGKDMSNQQTYFLSFHWKGNILPEFEIVDQIKNDTLIIIDNADDGYYYYYVKQ